jgi:hypothetical protein
MVFCLKYGPHYCLEDFVEWGSLHLEGKEMRAIICKLAWLPTVYHLWLQRNAIIHVGMIKTKDQILSLIRM